MNFQIYQSPAVWRKRLIGILTGASLILCAALVLSAGAAAQTRPKAKANNRLLEAERRLAELGYWIGKADGVRDASTYHALVAFQKVERRRRTGVLTDAELIALRAARRPAPKFAAVGARRVEVDLTRQVLFLIDENDLVTHILPVSSGNEEKYFDQGEWQTAHTPRGFFKVTWQYRGVRHASLGDLYYPSYFYGGVAIHGSNSIPTQPASHGCVRIPNFAAEDFQKMVAVGMDVIVYD